LADELRASFVEHNSVNRRLLEHGRRTLTSRA
jgi:hypothetical protein